QQSNVTADYDTGAGTQNLTMFGVALPASGGAVAGGTSTNPVRTDPTGTTTQPVSGTFWQATQPVSGTVTANVGTTNGLALDATLTGGTQKAIPRGAAKGTTAAGDVTSAAVDANTQAMHVQLAGTQPSVPVTGTFWQATQPVSGTVTSNIGTTN